MCGRARAFRVNEFSLIYRCSFLYIHCCLLNIMRLTPDPVLTFVTLSWPRFLTLSRTSDAMQVSLLVSLSLFNGVYVSAGIQTHYLTIPKHWAGQNMWIKPQRLRMTSIMSTSLELLLLFGFNVAFSNFYSYHDGVLLRQGAQCSLLLCCVTEVSCPRHLTWYHTQSHYPDTASTSPTSSP